MKIKTNILLWIILFLFSLIIWGNNTLASGVIPLTSWIKTGYYQIKWCSPHASLPNCGMWYFHKYGSIGKLTYKWENFQNGNLNTIKIETPPTSTRVASEGFISLFDGITSLEFEGEWTYTVTIFLVDYADNTAQIEYTYKIDKTAPQFQLTGITENSNFMYVHSDSKVQWINYDTLYKFDSATNGSDSNAWTYNTPSITEYSWPIPTEKTNHQRINLHTIYYKNNDSQQFNLTTLTSDTFWSSLRNFVSQTGKIELLKHDHTPISTLWQDLWIQTSKLGLWENSQWKFIVRIYDNTIWKNGWKANYSELVFYAVRDNTKPNMASGIDEKSAIEKLLTFENGWTTVWDTYISDNSHKSTNASSKFIAASTSQRLFSQLNDIGIQNGNNPEWYNAWIPTHWLSPQVAIEQAKNKNGKDYIFTYNDRYKNNNITDSHNFSKVDTDDLNNKTRENWYRKYSTSFSTSWVNWICDNVWNCLEPQLNFRVVANVLNRNNSEISLDIKSITGNNRIFANGLDTYQTTTKLKDFHGNAIVGVRAAENNNVVIKNVDIKFTFKNGLFPNQITTTPSGVRQVKITDLLPEKNDSNETSTGNINTDNWTISFKEIPENWYNINNWSYQFSASSLVPSAWAYPYLNENATLSLTNIIPKATNDTPTNWVWIYGNIWAFNNENIVVSWTTNMISSPNTKFLSNSDYKTDLDSHFQTDYWKIEINKATTTYSSLWASDNVSLEFASPFIYGAKDLSLNHLIRLAPAQPHIKEIHKFSNNIIDSNSYIQEQYLPSYTWAENLTPKFTPDIFNIYSDTTSGTTKINTWSKIPANYIGSSKEYFTKSSPIKENYHIDWYGFNMWYISHISYDIWGTQISLPSISRNVSDSKSDDATTADKNSRYYFPTTGPYNEWNWTYVILWDPILSAWLLSGMWIAITGMSNSEDLMIIDRDKWRKANLNVWENLTRYDFITNFKKNVALNTAWFGKWNNHEWCSKDIIDESFLKKWEEKCTININGEQISFIQWNTNIKCSNNNTCVLDNNQKRTIIVKDGSTYIQSNISTFGKNAQLLIGTITDSGLKNITIPDWSPTLTRDSNVNWWTFINQNVTNIDAFIVSQWPMVSYSHNNNDVNNWSLFDNNITSGQLENQLHIYGSTLSLNTIGWYKSEADSKCPYIIQNCSQKNAYIFDLVTIRRYSLESQDQTNRNTFIIAWTNGKRSGWLKNDDDKDCKITYDNESKKITFDSCATLEGLNPWDLRRITDLDYIIYPLLVERDNSWSKSPSIMSKIDK